jgi:hypothetical protein
LDSPQVATDSGFDHRKRQPSKNIRSSSQFAAESTTSIVHSARHLTHNSSSRCRTRIGTSVADGAIVTTVVDTPKLMDIILEPIINRQVLPAASCCACGAPVLTRARMQGLVFPNVPNGVQATVFAIYDSRQKLQYVGFSKDLRNSLRTVFSRRPDKAHFYK